MTLVELLASLSLMVVLLMVLSEFLYSGTRLWDKNDRAYERRQLLRSVAQTFNADLDLLVNSPFLAEAAFIGDEYGFVFWAETGDGLIQVKYSYDQQNQKVIKSVHFWGGKPVENTLFHGIKDWRIEYFRKKTENWELQWSPATKNEIPALIRVTFKTENTRGEVVVPIKAWHDESAGNAGAGDANGT
jgi:Type II secretory pathway, component PulJ